LNRKEAIIVALLLLTTFMGSTFAAPAVQQMLIVNDPLNVRIVGGPFTSHVTSLDIDVLSNKFNGIPISGNFPTWNLTAAFSFSPRLGFVQATAVLITIEWDELSNGHDDDRFSVRLNEGSFSVLAPLRPQTTQIGSLPLQDLRVGSNLLNLGVVPNNPSVTTSFLIYEVRLTVEYTFMA